MGLFSSSCGEALGSGWMPLPIGAAVTLVGAWLRRGPGEGWRKMYVKIMCLQDALYKAIKLSVSKTVWSRYKLCLWQLKIHFSCLFQCEVYQWVVLLLAYRWKTCPDSERGTWVVFKDAPIRFWNGSALVLWSSCLPKLTSDDSNFCLKLCYTHQ